MNKLLTSAYHMLFVAIFRQLKQIPSKLGLSTHISRVFRGGAVEMERRPERALIQYNTNRTDTQSFCRNGETARKGIDT